MYLTQKAFRVLWPPLDPKPKVGAVVDSLLGNLGTKMFHANSDVTTNEYASKLIGKQASNDSGAGGHFTLAQDPTTRC